MLRFLVTLLACDGNMLGPAGLQLACRPGSIHEEASGADSLHDAYLAFLRDAPVVELDWNLRNPLGADPGQVALVPLRFSSGDDAEMCANAIGDTYATAPMVIAMQSYTWLPWGTLSGALSIDEGTPLLSGSMEVSVEAYLAGARLAIEDQLGRTLEVEEVPTVARLDVSSGPDDTFEAGELFFTADHLTALRAGCETTACREALAHVTLAKSSQDVAE